MRWSSESIDARIRRELGGVALTSFFVHSRALPAYRFVDAYRAAEGWAGPGASLIDSESDEDLNQIFHGRPRRWTSRRLKRATLQPWPCAAGEEAHLPVDRFWLRGAGAAGGPVAVRVRYQPIQDKAVLEVAATRSAAAETVLEEIVQRSVAGSIYRGRLLALSFEPGTRDVYGDVEKPESLRLLFKPEESVEDEDVVIDDDVRTLLWRNVVDLHRRREILKRHGVPVRRGVLLYGPPGTGKTYACRYLCARLAGTTRIVVTGTALQQVASIFSIARLYQPSLVILEDVDLVFAAREINLYSSVLGELFDQMDGLRPQEDIGFILTTNAIERMEAAVRDRPGRISQCIHFAAPSGELRRRYLARYLRAYDGAKLDFDALVEATAGATQAFLKEWVHRAVQIACERLASDGDALDLQTEDFADALAEMRHGGDAASSRIIGFGASL
jgi:hypothetical protein